MIRKGTIVIFTGSKGCGKSTQAGLYAKSKGVSVSPKDRLMDKSLYKNEGCSVFSDCFLHDIGIDLNRGIRLRDVLSMYSSQLEFFRTLVHCNNVFVFNLDVDVNTCNDRFKSRNKILDISGDDVDWSIEDNVRMTMLNLSDTLYMGGANYISIECTYINGIELKDIVDKIIYSYLP